jgi:glycine/D-amino acid oxidase-like deaminating enzyme
LVVPEHQTVAASPPASTEVAIIGGGIVGTFLAWQLTRRGVRDVIVLEEKTVASGASGKTGALLRQHYTNPTEAKLAHAGLETFRQWSDLVGGDCGFVQSGIVITFPADATAAENIDRLGRNVAMQRSLGIDSRVLTPGELQSLQPFVRVDDLAGAAYEATSGYVDAIAATRSVAVAAERGGARVIEHCGVAAIETVGDRVTGVRTTGGIVATNTVVYAGGAGSIDLLDHVGVRVPIEAIRVQVAIVHRPLALDAPHAAFIDIAAGMFCRPWGPGRTLIGLSGGDQHDPVDPARYDERNDPSYPAKAIAAVGCRMPAMAGAAYLHGHAGLYDMTPDTHPILGASDRDGLLLAVGFSGAGFKKAPAVAQCLAELIVDGRASLVDLAPFRLDRFSDGSWTLPWSDSEYILASDFGHRF